MTRLHWLAKAKMAWQRAISHGFHWHLADPASTADANKVRAAARRQIHQRWPRILRPLAALLAVAGWPVFALIETDRLLKASTLKACPPNARRKAWWAAIRHNAPPTEYGAFGAWHAGAPSADAWLYTLESSELTAHLTDKAVSDLCGDKVAFAEFCAANSPHAVVPTLAVFRDGTPIRPFTGDLPPWIQLICKPVRTSQGRGLTKWSWDGNAFSSETGSISADALQGHFAAQSKQHPTGLLVQPALASTANLAIVSQQGPAVARIITARWPNGQVEVLNAMLQRPRADQYKTHGGPFRLINVETGSTAPRISDPHIFPTATNDPAFDNLTMPDWHDSLQHLKHLHSLMKGQAPLLGWDVIYTPDGPTILEANTTLAPYFFQLATQTPAAYGKWIALLAAYLP